MFTFFRKIRKSLTDSGHPRKYLVYSVGEIALVVLGILIALQINTWNENNKDDALERKLLIAVKNDLQSELFDYTYGFWIEKQSAESIDMLIEFMEDKRPYHDSLDFYFRQAVFVPEHNLSLSSYRSFNNPKGLDIIKSNSIRQFLQENTKKPEINSADIDEVYGIPAFVQPFYFKHFKTYTNVNSLESSKPVNLSLLKRDTTFKNILGLLKVNRVDAYQYGRSLSVPELQRIIQQIDHYLNPKSKSSSGQNYSREIKSFDTLLDEGQLHFNIIKAEVDSMMLKNQ